MLNEKQTVEGYIKYTFYKKNKTCKILLYRVGVISFSFLESFYSMEKCVLCVTG